MLENITHAAFACILHNTSPLLYVRFTDISESGISESDINETNLSGSDISETEISEASMISCQQYDYIEIACMYRYPVILVLKSGEELSGIATDTARNENKQECIRIINGDDSQLVVLDTLTAMKVTVNNPNFQEVFF